MGAQASKTDSKPASPVKIPQDAHEAETLKEQVQHQVETQAKEQVKEQKEQVKEQAKEQVKEAAKTVTKGKEATEFKGIPLANYEPTFEVEKTFEDKRYGRVTLGHEKGSKVQILKKEITVNSESAFEKELKFAQVRAAQTHESLVKAFGYNSKKESSFCATAFRLNVFVEYIEKSLQDRIKEAKAEGKLLADAEILLIAENLVSGLAYFQSHQINHGDIKAKNILVTPATYKLVDSSLTKDANALVAAIAGKKSTLAPEVLALVPKKDLKTTYDKTKADVFALGATLLKAATLEKYNDIFNYKEGKINEAILAERLAKVKAQYPAFTYELIRDMLTLDATHRPDFIQLEERLAPFRILIRSRRSIVQISKVDVFDDELLRRATLQIKKSQELRALIENEKLLALRPALLDGRLTGEVHHIVESTTIKAI